MSTSTEYLLNGIADTFCRNSPLVVSGLYATLHRGDPGSAVTSNLVDTEEARDQITCAEASGGIASVTGDPATWVAEEAATITYIGFHDALTSGNALGYTVVDAPQLVTEGDTVQLTAFTFTVTD